MVKFLKKIGTWLLVVFGIKILVKMIQRHKEGQQRPPYSKVTAERSVLKYIPTQLVVWRKPGVTDAEFSRWKDEALKKYRGLAVKKLCPNCDNSLELWEGDNVTTLIMDKTAGAGASNTSGAGGLAGGGDAVACFTYNLIIDLPEPLSCLPERVLKDPPQRPSIPGPALTVAVFDTGLSKEMKNVYTEATPSCIPGGEKGWSFPHQSNITDDDHPLFHGTIVSRFIAEQETKYRKQKISILPVKIHNSEGKGDLFSVLCGFAYAANCGAKIINASFGFYASKGTEAPLILSEFVKKHLTGKNIILVAAAGNLNPDATAGGPVSPDVRNLELNPFFPACLSKTHGNVLAVTTVSKAKLKVSPSQNFSKLLVEVSVDGDAEIQNDYRFKNPIADSFFIVGSSYAAPIIAGKIAQHYTELMKAMPAGTINKDILLREMKNLGLIIPETGLSSLVKDGNYTKRL